MSRGRKKKQVGIIPTGNVTLVASTAGYHLFRLDDRSSIDWVNFKLVFAGKREHKANFSFGWNGERFAKCHDMDAMVEHYPELLEFVSEHVKVRA